MRAALLLVPFLSVLLLASPLAAEEPAADPGLALVAKINELHKAKDEVTVRAEVSKVPDAFKAAEAPATKTALVDVLGKVAKDKKMPDAREAAVQAIGEIADKKMAWKELKPLMPDVKTEEPTAFDTLVVKTTGVIADEGAIPDLFTMVEKAKANALGREAALALGGYTAASKKKKIEILDTLLSFAVKIKPSQGGSSGKQTSPEATERFSLIGGGIIDTAVKLTGRQVKTWEEWEVLYKDNKKNLSKLMME